nr:NAC domain-containing protein [Tanacetum cinerariifolium]
MNRLQEILSLRNSNQYPSIDLYDLKRSDKGDNEIDSLTKEPSDTLLMGDEVISTTPKRENDEFIKSSVDDLVLIPKELVVTSVCDDLECDMPVNTPLPTTNVREKDFDINSPLGEYVVDFLMENVDVDGLPRHLVKQIFSHLLKNPSLTKGMSDEPLGDDSKPRSYDVTFLNPLFDFNDDFTLFNDNLLFDEEFEDISSLDPHELTPVINESTLLVTQPLPCTDVLGDDIVDIDLLLGEHLDTLSTGDREIDFNPSMDIEELERLLADDHVPVPKVFDKPLGNSDSMSRSSETSDLFEELIVEFSLDNSNPTKIDDRFDNNVSFEEEVVHQRLRKTLTHVLELSSCIYLDDRAWGS